MDDAVAREAATRTAPPERPVPDVDRRTAWRETRRGLESRRIASTPLGDRPPKLADRALEAGIRLTDRLLHLSGLRRWVARHAMAVERIETTLRVADLPPDLDGYRIAHVTDPHFDALPGLGARIAELLSDGGIDLLAITGDYRFSSHGPFVEHAVMDELRQIAQAARPADGALAVLGNHDTADMADAIENAGIRVLVNETATIRRGAARLDVTGTDDVNHHYTPAAPAALGAVRGGGPSFALALVHSPELAGVAARAGYHLYLCGHTHGGQIVLPNGRPLVTHLHTHCDLAAGLWRLGGMTGYTSRGAGTSGLPIRLNCPGEVTVFTLRRGAPEPGSGRSSRFA